LRQAQFRLLRVEAADGEIARMRDLGRVDRFNQHQPARKTDDG